MEGEETQKSGVELVDWICLRLCPPTWVLHLLDIITERNALSYWVEKLFWGSLQPLTPLGLKQEPDFVLAADVVYGSNLEVWDVLVEKKRRCQGAAL